MFEKKKGLKGQAMMEYLMTYGFAIFVIVIVLAILFFYLGQINTPETCAFDKADFNCQSPPPVLVASAGSNTVSMIVKIENNDKNPIVIEGVLCTTAAKGEIDKAWSTDVSPATGGITIGSGTSTPIDGTWPSIACKGKDGITPLTLNPNSEFKGNLVIWYHYTERLPGEPLRKANAVVTGKVLQS
ncbi:MAG: hypothetical protein ABII22_02535 [Candidatus Micrarchaeota archaeon]